MLFRIVFFCLCAFLDYANAAEPNNAPTILYSKNSPFGFIEVVTTEDPGVLNICDNKDYNATHSQIVQGDATYLGMGNTLLSTASFCFIKGAEKVLLLGLGGGEFLSYLAYYFPNMNIDVVELNPVMIDIVKNFRKIDIKGDINFKISDAFQYVKESKQKYDLIYCDVYGAAPSKVEEYAQFFERIKGHLTEEGVFVWNAFIPYISQAIIADMLKNFQNTNIIAATNDDGHNIIFICYLGPEKTMDELEKIAKNLQSQYSFRYNLLKQIKNFAPVLLNQHETLIATFPILN